MYLYKKNIYKALIFPFFIITLSIVGISWIIQSIRYFEIILNQGAKIFDFVGVTICLIPLLIFIILPISLFFTIYYTYKKLSHDREIIVLYSFGITRIKLINPFLLFAMIIITLHYIVSIYFLPISTHKLKTLKLKIDQNSIINLLQFNTFISKINGITIYIEKKEPDNLLRNIFIYNLKDPKKDITFIANSGRFYNTNSGAQLILYNGCKLEFNRKYKEYSLIKFSKSLLNLNDIVKKKIQSKQNSYEFAISELLFSDKFPKNQISKFRGQGHFRILWPLTSISIVITMLFFLTQYEQTRIQEIKTTFYTFISTLLIIITTLSLYTLNHNNQRYYMVMYFINISIPISILSILYLDNKKRSISKYIFKIYP